MKMTNTNDPLHSEEARDIKVLSTREILRQVSPTGEIGDEVISLTPAVMERIERIKKIQEQVEASRNNQE